MKRENRYVVIKRSDLQRYILRDFRVQLQGVIETINQSRDFFEGKCPLECVVVEKDWPEYELVWELIRLRVERRKSPPKPSRALWTRQRSMPLCVPSLKTPRTIMRLTWSALSWRHACRAPLSDYASVPRRAARETCDR